MRETDADRSWQAGHGEPWTSKRDEQGRFLFGYSPSKLIWRTWRCTCSHIPLKERTQIRKVMLQKWRHNNGSTVFMLISAKTKRDLLCEQKSMATWQQQNLGTITDTLSWYKFSPLGGIRVKPKLHMRRRRIYESLEKPSQKPKVIHTYNLWTFGKYFEESSWNLRATTLHWSETSGIAERAVRRQKEETSAVLLQSGSDDKWRSDSMECYCCLRDDQDLLADGKFQNERRFGASFFDMLRSRGEFGKKLFWLLRLKNWKS